MDALLTSIDLTQSCALVADQWAAQHELWAPFRGRKPEVQGLNARRDPELAAWVPGQELQIQLTVCLATSHCPTALTETGG